MNKDVEQPFVNDIRYIYPEGGPRELVVVTENLEKPWVAVDKLKKTQRIEKLRAKDGRWP